MTCRRSLNIVAILASLVVPLAALAQIPTGSVTTDPAHQAPALGIPLLVVLVAVMAGIALYRLRPTPTIAALVIVAAVTGLGGLGYARPPGVTINGGECAHETVSPFDAFTPTELMSSCPNLIQIVDIQVSCNPSPFAPSPNRPILPDCSVGQILANGDACVLPLCSPLP